MLRSSMTAAVVALSIACALHAPAHAASRPGVLTVESVLSPAWLERANGRREPLAVGMTLRNKDKVHTGGGGRAMLRMSEGSAVKLGESAVLAVDELVRKRDSTSGASSAHRSMWCAVHFALRRDVSPNRMRSATCALK